jgi:hypothetical protein
MTRNSHAWLLSLGGGFVVAAAFVGVVILIAHYRN